MLGSPMSVGDCIRHEWSKEADDNGQRTTLCWMVSWAHEVPAANLADQIRYELPGWVAL